MAIKFVSSGNSTTTGNASTRTFTVDSSTGRNRLIVVGMGDAQPGGAIATVTSATYGGVSLKQAVYVQDEVDDPSVSCEIWYLFNPPAGSNTVSVTFSSSIKAIVGAACYTGVKSTGIGNTNSTFGTGDLSTTIATTQYGSLVFGLYNQIGIAQTITPGANINTRWAFATSGGDDSENVRAYGTDKFATNNSTYTMDYTSTTGEASCLAAVEFLAAKSMSMSRGQII